jgi:FkbM family methyltransferase
MIPLVKKLHRKVLRRLALPGLLTTATIQIGGQSFLTPKVDAYMCESSELWMIDLLAIMLSQKTGTLMDVGVNIGQTLLAVKATDPKRRYVGLEPNPICVAYVERLIRLNKLSDCLIVPVGLANETGIKRLQLYYGDGVDSTASLVEGFRPEQKISGIKLVPVCQMSDVESAVALTDLGIVKIDVEGGEQEVMATMHQAIERYQPWLVVEILPCYNLENHERMARQLQIEQQLRDLNYAMFRIAKTTGGRLAGLEAVTTIGIHANASWCDYVFCPQRDIGSLIAAMPPGALVS